MAGRVGGGLPGQRKARHGDDLPGQHQEPHQARPGGRLGQLHPHTVQGFINGLKSSPAFVRLAYKNLFSIYLRANE